MLSRQTERQRDRGRVNPVWSRSRGGIIIIIADICPGKREESISISSIIFAVWFHLFVGLVRFIKILSILLSIGQVELGDRGSQ